jgi:hypothetical protein
VYVGLLMELVYGDGVVPVVVAAGRAVVRLGYRDAERACVEGATSRDAFRCS